MVEESLCDVDGFLTGHRIHHQQHFVGLRRLLDGGELPHERIVDLQAARGIDDDDVEAFVPGMLDRGLGELGGLAFSIGEHRDVNALAQRLELVDGGRPLQVGGNKQRTPPLRFEMFGQLGCGRGLT